MTEALAWLAGGLCVAVLAFALATWIKGMLKRRRVLATYPPLGQFLTIDGHRVHYLQFGAGPDLVILHGATTQMREAMETYAPDLGRDFRVTIIDRPGMGYSDRLSREGESLKQQAAHLDRVLETLGIERTTLLGQSFGGSIALAWVLSRPARIEALALTATPTYRWIPRMPWRIKGPAMPYVGPLIAQFVFVWFPESYYARKYREHFFPASQPEDYTTRIGTPLSVLPGSIVSDNRQLARMEDDLTELAPHYSEISVPVEIVNGAEDMIVAPDLHAIPLGREIPGARVKLLKGLGHMPHVGDPDGINGAVRRAARRARTKAG